MGIHWNSYHSNILLVRTLTFIMATNFSGLEIACAVCANMKDQLNTTPLNCQAHYICKDCLFERCKSENGDLKNCSYCSTVTSVNRISIYVDNSNLWIEGKKAYARVKGLSTPEDPRARFDIGKVGEVVAAGRENHVDGRTLYGSRPPEADTVWKKIEKHKWLVDISDKSFHTGKEKQVDAKLITDLVSLVTKSAPGVVIIVSGDADYIPPIEKALECKWQVEVWAWKQAISSAIKNHPSLNKGLQVHYLDENLDDIMFINDELNPSKATKKQLESAIIFNIKLDGSAMKQKTYWKVKHDLQELTRWPIVYYTLPSQKDAFVVEVLAMFMTVNSESYNIDKVLRDLKSKWKKTLHLSGDPLRYDKYYTHLEDKGALHFMTDIFPRCKSHDSEQYDNMSEMSDTSSIKSRSSSKSTGRDFNSKDLYKTTLCVHFNRSSCSRGDSCRYAHGYKDPKSYCTVCEKPGHVFGSPGQPCASK